SRSPHLEPQDLATWSSAILFARPNPDGSSGPEGPEATLVEPVDLKQDRGTWVATLTYRLVTVCPDGKQHHSTVVIESPYLPPPAHPSNSQISEYNAVMVPRVQSVDAQVVAALKVLDLKCSEFTVPAVRCSLQWKDTALRFDGTLPATFYTLQLTLDVGSDLVSGEPGSAKQGRREWTRTGRADGSRSHYGCAGSASFTVDRAQLDGMSDAALRQLAESYVTYCDPFSVPLQLT